MLKEGFDNKVSLLTKKQEAEISNLDDICVVLRNFSFLTHSLMLLHDSYIYLLTWMIRYSIW